MAIAETTNNPTEAAVRGENTGSGGKGIHGLSNAGSGIYGESLTGRGVVGTSDAFQGVFGKSTDNAGVVGESDRLHGVFGICHDLHGGGIFGTNNVGGFGVIGVSESGNGVGVSGKGRRGVVGESDTFQGVYGWSRENAGVVGESERLHGMFGICHDPNGGGVYGTNDKHGGFGVIGVNDLGIGVSGRGGLLAGLFEGDVKVTKTLFVGEQVVDVIKLFQVLQERIAALEASVVTVAGVPTHRPTERPVISPSQGPPVSEGFAFFEVTGSGFHSRVQRPVIHIHNDHTGKSSTRLVSQDLPGDGTFAERAIQVECHRGERLSFSANDRSPDTNDLTGILWSETVKVTCV